jgi:outer membrane protein
MPNLSDQAVIGLYFESMRRVYYPVGHIHLGSFQRLHRRIIKPKKGIRYPRPYQPSGESIVQRTLRVNERLIIVIAIIGTVAIPAIPASAQSIIRSNVSSSTMDALARVVIETNPEIAAQRQQVRIAKARMQAAEAGYLPSIEANGLVQKRQIDVKNGESGDARFVAGQASVEARVRVYDGDRTYNAVQVAKAELESAEAALQAVTSDVLLELLTAAADVHTYRQIKQFSEAQSDAIAEQLRATSRRMEFGESTRTDENLAKARLATSRAGILAATEELNVSGNRFRAVSGQSATVVPPLPALAALPGSLTQAQTVAFDASPRIRVARLNADASKKGIRFAKGALFPQLDAVGGYEFLTGGVANLFTGKLPDDRSALFSGIELRVPIFQPRDFAEIRRAHAVRDQRLAQTQFAERTASEEVATSWTRWQSAKSTIEAAQAAVDAIAEAAEGIKKESVGGNRTLAEVLDAQNELLAARITLERAIRNEFVSRAGVLAATGNLSVDTVLASSARYKADTPDRPALSALGAVVARPDAVSVQPTTTARPYMASLEATASTAALPGQDNPPNRPEVSRLGSKIIATK